MPLNRKTTRLPKISYVGQKPHFITICCDNRLPHLGNPATASNVISILSDSAARHHFLLHAYCAMPDHLHFLAHGLEPTSNMLDLLKLFKSRTAYQFKRQHGARLWEMSYYDHDIRRAEAIESVACYIWNNPVRADLCKAPNQYPFSGSQTIDWTKKSRLDESFIPPWKSSWPV